MHSESELRGEISRRGLIKGVLGLLGLGVVGKVATSQERGSGEEAMTTPAASPVESVYHLTEENLEARRRFEEQRPLKEKLVVFKQALEKYIRKDSNLRFWIFIDSLTTADDKALQRLFRAQYDEFFIRSTDNERYQINERYQFQLQLEEDEDWFQPDISLTQEKGAVNSTEKLELTINFRGEIAEPFSGESGIKSPDYSDEELEEMASQVLVTPPTKWLPDYNESGERMGIYSEVKDDQKKATFFIRSDGNLFIKIQFKTPWPVGQV